MMMMMMEASVIDMGEERMRSRGGRRRMRNRHGCRFKRLRLNDDKQRQPRNGTTTTALKARIGQERKDSRFRKFPPRVSFEQGPLSNQPPLGWS